MKILRLSFVTALLMIFLAGCAPSIHPQKDSYRIPRLTGNLFIAEDGAGIPVRRWLPDRDVKAVVIALHGFNLKRSVCLLCRCGKAIWWM
ncbi:MAG: hypothetical protein FJ190_12530 [Gammaproteobacteria bacterium]|nr:hypothetical protein [Gammaproteobacteria bacterium]